MDIGSGIPEASPGSGSMNVSVTVSASFQIAYSVVSSLKEYS